MRDDDHHRGGDARGAVARLVERLFDVHAEEVPLLVRSWGFFFCLLASYFILRPLREQMGLAGGVEQLPWLFLGTLGGMLLVTPLFSKLVGRHRRAVFLPLVYRVALANLAVFFVLIRFGPEGWLVHVGRVFYVWVSVYNMFAISVFWSFMADLHTSEQGKRLFGLIGVCGTLGAIVGSGLTAALVTTLGSANMLLVSMLLLELAVRFVRSITRREHIEPRPGERPHDAASAGWRGFTRGIALFARSPYLLGIGLYLFAYTASSTFLYFQQAHIVDAAIVDADARTHYFSIVSLGQQSLTLVMQLFLTGRLIAWIGLGRALTVLPVIAGTSLIALAAAPSLAVNTIVQIASRATSYGLARPAREALFTVLGREEKYKAKNFVDTFVYRGGDALAATAFGALTRVVTGSTALAVIALPLTFVWAVTGLLLGRTHGRRENADRAIADSSVNPAVPDAS